MCTATGEEHGLINQLPNAVPFDDFKSMTPEFKAKAKKELEHRKKMSKGRYINTESYDDRLDKTYCAGAGEPLQTYHLIPDQVYDLPLGFIEEVNQTEMAVRSDLLSVDGVNVTKDGTATAKDRVKRVHQIVPIGF